MKAILIVVLGVILAGMILGLVFKLIGLAITAAVVIVIAYFVWRPGRRPGAAAINAYLSIPPARLIATSSSMACSRASRSASLRTRVCSSSCSNFDFSM